MQFSPKLKKAMNEIKFILQKHDIAGVVVLHTPGHGEELCHLTPTYSCANLHANGELRFKAKAADFGGDTKKRDQKITDTSNMMAILSERTGVMALNLMNASDMRDKNIGADHGPGSYTPQIDN
jgi:hypothetical protein